MNNYGSNGSAEGDRDSWMASRSRGRGSSVSRPHESQKLRRPHQALPDNQILDQTTFDILQKTKLSPNAAEFIPRSLRNMENLSHINQSVTNTQSHGIRHSVQNRFELARQTAPVNDQQQQYNMYQPRQQQQIPEQSYYQSNQQFYHYGSQAHYNSFYFNDHNTMNQQQERRSNDQHVVDLNVTISQLESSILTLTLSPGEFDCLVSHLVDIISPFLENPSQCREIVAVIIKQSVNEGNFRYNGARLCTHLDTVATPSERKTSTFREILLQECQEETQKQGNDWQQNTIHSEADEKKCHGLILFLAELVTQMHTSAAAVGEMLIQLITTVLRKPAPTSAKNICQALKLAGQTLERDNAGARKDMESVMRQLTNLVIEGRVDSHVERMVDNVTELRSNSWGRTVSNITPTCRPLSVDSNVSSKVQQSLDEPVLYGPDGKVLSTEESEFLEDLINQSSSDDGNNIHELWRDYDEEEEEENDVIAAAYEEFLKLPKNNSNQIKHQ